MKFPKSITADFVTFTGEILNGKLQFLCSVRYSFYATFMIHLPRKHICLNQLSHQAYLTLL